MHPNGKRLSSKCPLREKCTSADCKLDHPICRLDKSCSNSKCGFTHTDGRRFTREQKQASVIEDTFEPPIIFDQAQKLDFVKHTYSIADLKQIHLENNQVSQSSFKCIDAFQGNSAIKTAGRTVSAKGHVKSIDGTRKAATIQIFLPSVATHSDFVILLKQCDIVVLSLESSESPALLCSSLREGDKVSFSLTVCANSASLFLASNLQLIKFSKREDSDGICDLVRLAINEVCVDTALLDQILNLSSITVEVVREIIIASHKLLCLNRRLVGTKKFQVLLLESDLFTLQRVQTYLPKLQEGGGGGVENIYTSLAF